MSVGPRIIPFVSAQIPSGAVDLPCWLGQIGKLNSGCKQVVNVFNAVTFRQKNIAGPK
jgi:hypothetical protein